MLKRASTWQSLKKVGQPPSGGCVLKQYIFWLKSIHRLPAAFGRLCVETDLISGRDSLSSAAAFGRLCVETLIAVITVSIIQPAAFGRLCVETAHRPFVPTMSYPAAFGRLCVETDTSSATLNEELTSRLRAAVC